MKKNYFGVMLDMSGNAVMKAEKVKEYALYLKKIGYNMIQLYTEDTYEVDGEPFFGYMRGGYSKDDLKEIDAYCNSIGIEVIPCIQTLAHLSRIFRWDGYADINDADDMLLIDDERTYALIENMFATLAQCFSSRTVNIGLDEAHRMGLGKYLRKNGFTDRFALFIKHLKKVISIAEKYGFRAVMWSDMLLRLLSGGDYNAEAEQISAVKDRVPKNVGLIYWEYFYYKSEQYREMLQKHKLFGNDVWFAGAVHTYIGFAPINDMADDTLRPAMRACREEGIGNILITLWGGSECSYIAALPALCYARCISEGITDEKQIEKRFFEATGEDYRTIRSLDASNSLAMPYLKLPEVDFSKYVLYQDVFNGFFDTELTEGTTKKFLAKAEEFEALSAGRFGYLFQTQAKLLRALHAKHDLGIRLRRAYSEGDKEELSRLYGDILHTAACVEEFYRAFRAQWYIENTPQGFDMNDIKLGGLIWRLRSCADRLNDYLQGRAERIEELEKPLLKYKGDTANYMQWARIVSANCI